MRRSEVGPLCGPSKSGDAAQGSSSPLAGRSAQPARRPGRGGSCLGCRRELACELTNLGQTLLSLRSLDRSRRYVGFEPNVDCVSAVRRIIKKNGMEESTVIPAACSGSFGLSRLFHYTDSQYDSAASMVPDFRDASMRRGESVIVEAAVGSCLEVLQVDRIGLVKIDVEGFEAEVLEALEPLLFRDMPPILIEVLSMRDSVQRRESGKRIMDLLARLNFTPYRIAKDAVGHFAEFAKQERVVEQEEVSQSDFLLVPKAMRVTADHLERSQAAAHVS